MEPDTSNQIILVCIADTHNLHEQIDLPPGDILIHAGDITGQGELADVAAFNDWLGSLPYREKIVIAGNHDFCFERQPDQAQDLLTHCTYLQDTGVTLDGIRFWGTPWQPWFFDWAFNLHRGTPELIDKWKQIPDNTDILISHGPPLGHGDLTARGEKVGCADLLNRVGDTRPKLHCFGHIHEGYGTSTHDQTLFANVSICNLAYQPVNQPLVVKWFRDQRTISL